MGDLISNIGKLAAMKNIAIVLTSQTTTRVRAEKGAILHPAISGTAWDTAINTRIVLFRDWLAPQEVDGSSQEARVQVARFAGVIKTAGVSYGGMGKIVPFAIEKVREGARFLVRRVAN